MLQLNDFKNRIETMKSTQNLSAIMIDHEMTQASQSTLLQQ